MWQTWLRLVCRALAVGGAASHLPPPCRFFWWTPAGSPQRAKVTYVVKLGSLVGKAVAAISETNTTGSCKGLAPAVDGSMYGSTLFIYHPQAVQQWRRSVTDAMAAKGLIPAKDTEAFAKLWDDIAGLQLGATLKLLPPANDVGVWPVGFKTAPSK